MFTMLGGTIYGKSDTLPAGVDTSLANSAKGGSVTAGAASSVEEGAKWGTGGAYTKGVGAPGGAAQTGGRDIGATDDTLIAKPAP
jgi:hypothetical protein